MTARDSFVERFGEDQAVAIEAAAKGHFGDQSAFGGIHDNDNLGSDEFRYWFLLAIGYECVTRYRGDHGITADVDAMKEWARGEGQLGHHDGDAPDYLALFAGAYEDWIYIDPELGPDAARVVPSDAEVPQP
jgi:hypothetical protein